jgi:hypothetical protein
MLPTRLTATMRRRSGPTGGNLLLKERDFRLIVVAVGLSSFGDVLAAVASLSGFTI